MSIYKDCDIRGVYGQDLTEEIMSGIGVAVSQILEGRSIVVGGDFRVHTPALKQALIDALVKGGAQVIDVGQVSTPQLYFSKRYLQTYASAQITASHNPAKYNGLKLMFGDLPVLPEDIIRIRELAERGEGERREDTARCGATLAADREADGNTNPECQQEAGLNHQPGTETGQKSRTETDQNNTRGTCQKTDTTEAYMTMLKGVCRPLGKPLHVVVDAGNGAMSEAAPALLEALGIKVTRLFCEYDGTFPGRDPNPAVKAHLSAVRELVRKSGADFGAAFDGDGDRVIFIDENGEVLMAEEAMVLFVKALARENDSVVYDQKSSSILKAAILEKKGRPIMERSGHAFIRRTFIQDNSVFAGEVSGHYFFRELAGDDGLFALVQMLNIVGNADCSIRELLSDVQYPCITPDIRVQADEQTITDVLEKMEVWAKEPEVTPYYIDGIRLEFADGSWILLRRSVTEPAFTMRIEAPTQERLEEIKTESAKRIGYPM